MVHNIFLESFKKYSTFLYVVDALSIYKKINSENAVLLHSSRSNGKERYSIVAFDPFFVFESENGKDPFQKLGMLLKKYKTKRSNNPIFDGLNKSRKYVNEVYVQKNKV